MLTASQLEALRQGRTVMVVVPEVGTECVLIRRDVYDRLTQAQEVDGGFDASEAYLSINDVMAADDANDPWLESYQR
ncbi:MAG: hypothetical protein IT428_09920 [Planctomycetaceae bacterium]|nr:hypothetical protein [Planctomycetaceae bacterium]